jgi:hypothetical protein
VTTADVSGITAGGANGGGTSDRPGHDAGDGTRRGVEHEPEPDGADSQDVAAGGGAGAFTN